VVQVLSRTGSGTDVNQIRKFPEVVQVISCTSSGSGAAPECSFGIEVVQVRCLQLQASCLKTFKSAGCLNMAQKNRRDISDPVASIKCMREQPILWDSRAQDYKLSERKPAIWASSAEKFGCDHSEYN
jgi:hypothetical protein